MKISDYVPKLYQDNVEMSALIESEEEEFENHIKFDIDNSYNNEFATTADIDGIKMFEKILDIQLDENKDDIEYRRSKVISKLSSSGNLTMNWLKNNLNNLVGQGNYQLILYNDLYKLVINVSDLYADTANKIYNTYKDLIPANLIFEVYLIDTIDMEMYVGFAYQDFDLTYVNMEVI